MTHKSIFRTSKYPFLVDIEVDGKKLISLNSDNIKVKMYRRDNGKVVEFLKTADILDKSGNKISVILDKKAFAHFHTVHI